MPIVLSVDLGTTSISAIAVDVGSATLLHKATQPNRGKVAGRSDCENKRSEWERSEWDMEHIVERGLRCLQDVVGKLEPAQRLDVAGIGVTGQQHGVVVLDRRGQTITPLINWQDRRTNELVPGSSQTYLAQIRDRLGSDTWRRTGCVMQPGFLAATLYWITENGGLPSEGIACFATDAFTSRLTVCRPCTEPSCAGGSGVFNVRDRQWDDDAIAALQLPRHIFPEVREANDLAGTLASDIAAYLGLPGGTPVSVGIGDHQASFIGSIADRDHSLLINVGTGAQVARFTDGYQFELPVELRPLPIAGNVASVVGLSGGWAFQILNDFVVDVATHLDKTSFPVDVYAILVRLAALAPPESKGLSIQPTFSGTRTNPNCRGSISGITPDNFNVACLSRAFLESIAAGLFEGYGQLSEMGKVSSITAAGNGLRENALLAGFVSRHFDLPIRFTCHREEAAFGAVLTASVASGIFATLDQASQHLIRHE